MRRIFLIWLSAFAALLSCLLIPGSSALAATGLISHHKSVVKDWNASANANSGTVTVTGQAVVSGDVLVAYVAGDGPNSAGSQTATVSGCGLTWSLLARENAQAGDAETWRATASAAQSTCSVTAKLGTAVPVAATVADYGAAGTPTATIAAASSGAAQVAVSNVPSGSALWMVGDDWDNPTSRTLLSGDTMVKQVLSSTGDTYWTEQSSGAVSGNVTIGTSAPTGDRYNAVAVVIPPASQQQQPPSAPTGLTVTGITSTTASLSWSAPGGTVTGYHVYRNGVQVASPSGTTYTDSGLSPSTTYTYTVSAYNSAGESAQSGSVQATTSAQSSGSFPDATTTGPGVACSSLPAASSPNPTGQGNSYVTNVTTDGTVISNLNLTGSLDVYANNVTVQNVCITTKNWWGINLRAGFTGLKVLHVTIVGVPGQGLDNGGEDYGVSSSGGSVEVGFSDVSSVGDALSMGTGYIHDNYVHDLQSYIPLCGSSPCTYYQHTDDVISDGGSGLDVEHNTLLNQMDTAHGASASVGLFADSSAVTNATVNNNFMAGGAYCLYPGGGSTSSGIVITNNQFSTRYWSTCGEYGPDATSYWHTGSGNVWSGNTWADGPNAGQPVNP